MSSFNKLLGKEKIYICLPLKQIVHMAIHAGICLRTPMKCQTLWKWGMQGSLSVHVRNLGLLLPSPSFTHMLTLKFPAAVSQGGSLSHGE